ncbi:MAG: ABC transporter permease [Eubacteriales bacterium]|nr:ABC transporter permease [Eubacteriales bacterium]
MKDQELFAIVGIRSPKSQTRTGKPQRSSPPLISVILLAAIILGCLFAGALSSKDPTYLDLMNYTHAPDREFLFGTDTLGRDIFSCIWHGGRISLFIGIFATAISTVIAVVYGSLCGIAPQWLDTLMMRLTEILLSVPTLLIIIFIQAVLGEPNVLSIAFVIGITSWCSIAKVIRTEVRQLRCSEYVVASRCMGGGFFHILRKHLAPNFVSSIMFMVVMNVRSAIVSESTLSFMGMGLPLEIISWGSMLSLADKALMTGAWWIILIPGAFLVTLLMCMTNLGNWLRKSINQTESNL